MRQCGGDAVENALEVHIDHAVPVLNLPAFKRRLGHQPGIIEDDIDAVVFFHGMIHEMLDLFMERNVCLNGCVLAEGKLFRQRLKPVETPRSENELSAECGQPARCCFPKTAAGSCDDNY